MQPVNANWEGTTMAKPIFTQVIERARAYVAVRSHWTRYTLALTRNNRDCEPTDAKAVALLRLRGAGARRPTT